MNCRAICICILVTLTLFRGDSETSQNWIALTAYRKASISILFPGLWAVQYMVQQYEFLHNAVQVQSTHILDKSINFPIFPILPSRFVITQQRMLLAWVINYNVRGQEVPGCHVPGKNTLGNYGRCIP